MWPGPRLPISHTMTSVPSAADRIVSGNPTSLLNDAGLATVLNLRPRMAAAKSFVQVLPVEPVMPTTVASLRPRSSAARSSSARRVSGTAIRAPFRPAAAVAFDTNHSSSTSAPAAPAPSARSTKA